MKSELYAYLPSKNAKITAAGGKMGLNLTRLTGRLLSTDTVSTDIYNPRRTLFICGNLELGCCHGFAKILHQVCQLIRTVAAKFKI